MKTKHIALCLKGKLRANLTFLKPSILLALMNECIKDILLTSLPTEGATDRNTEAKRETENVWDRNTHNTDAA